jgi:hypothetical protein
MAMEEALARLVGTAHGVGGGARGGVSAVADYGRGGGAGLMAGGIAELVEQEPAVSSRSLAVRKEGPLFGQRAAASSLGIRFLV